MRIDARQIIELLAISDHLALVSIPGAVGVCGGDQPSNLKNAVNT